MKVGRVDRDVLFRLVPNTQEHCPAQSSTTSSQNYSVKGYTCLPCGVCRVVWFDTCWLFVVSSVSNYPTYPVHLAADTSWQLGKQTQVPSEWCEPTDKACAGEQAEDTYGIERKRASRRHEWRAENSRQRSNTPAKRKLWSISVSAVRPSRVLVFASRTCIAPASYEWHPVHTALHRDSTHNPRL